MANSTHKISLVSQTRASTEITRIVDKWARFSSFIQCKPQSLSLMHAVIVPFMPKQIFLQPMMSGNISVSLLGLKTPVSLLGKLRKQREKKGYLMSRHSLFSLNLAGQACCLYRESKKLKWWWSSKITSPEWLTAYLANSSLQNGIKPPLWCISVTRHHLLLHFFVETINLVRKRQEVTKAKCGDTVWEQLISVIREEW